MPCEQYPGTYPRNNTRVSTLEKYVQRFWYPSTPDCAFLYFLPNTLMQGRTNCTMGQAQNASDRMGKH